MIVEVSVATLLELGAPPEELDALGVRPSDAALRLDWTARGLVVAVRAPRLYQAAYDAGELPRVACIGRDPWDVLGGRGLSLAGVYLPAATFAGASAAVADFTDARLELACFVGADLRHASLRRANLRGADLGNANLCGADLTGADLTGADLTGVRVDGETQWEGATLAGAYCLHGAPIWAGWAVDESGIVVEVSK